MSEQDGTQASTRKRRSRQAKQDGTEMLAPTHPTRDDRDEWKAYWKAQDQLWRTEPEIDDERQTYLAQCRAIMPNIEQGIYPFKDIKLSRADVEWLLATHENGRGPVDWRDESQHQREGLDLRGADLRHMDLLNLPLACTHGGLTWKEWDQAFDTAPDERAVAGAHLERANLQEAHLEGADLCGVHLEGANLTGAYVEGANLIDAHLEGANLPRIHLERAHLLGAYLEGANLSRAFLEETDFSWAHLEGTCLEEACLRRAKLFETYLGGADLRGSHLQGTDLTRALLKGMQISTTDLERVRKWKLNFPTSLPPADLRSTFFDKTTKLDGINLGNKEQGFVTLADVDWGGVNLAVVDWNQIDKLGDERKAEQQNHLDEYKVAVRANRQLAVVLRDQGLNEQAGYFTYHAQVLQRRAISLQVLQRQKTQRQEDPIQDFLWPKRPPFAQMLFLLITLYIQMPLLVLFLGRSTRFPIKVFLAVEFALLGL
jgi:uncharacterized protein YjbI with pentapeptide repeats